MHIPRPLLTLVAGGALGGALLGANLVADHPPPSRLTAAAPTTTKPTATPDPRTTTQASEDPTGEPQAVAAPQPQGTSTIVAADDPPAAPPGGGAVAAQGGTAGTTDTADTGDTADTADSGNAGVRGYAGRLPDDRYGLVLAVRDGQAVAYLCDGDRVEVWLRGTVEGSTVTATAPDGERLSARLVTGLARVDLTALDQDWTFTMSAVDPGSIPSVTKKVQS